MLIRAVLVALLAMLVSRNANAEEAVWPQFRGPGARGIAADSPTLPERWSATENVRWKRDIPGRGWSSPVVWGKHVYLTTVVSEGQVEEQTKGLYLGGERPEPPKEVHHWRAMALDLETGAIVWDREVHSGVPTSSIHLKNTFASETAVTDGQRVVFHFGNLGLYCFSAEGEPEWSQPLGPFPTANGWGTGGSPTLDGDRLYVVADNEKQSFLAAFDKKTGRELWRTDRPERSSWSTPLVWKNSLRTEIVVSGSGFVRSYDQDGHELWHFGEMSRNAIPSPFADGDTLYIAAGHVMSKLKTMAAIRPGASGNISLSEDETHNEFVTWAQPKAAPYQPTPVLYDGRLYVLMDGSFFACYDAKSGKQIYDKHRIPDGRMFTASPWAYNGQVFCLNEDGVTHVVKAGPKFEVIAANPLAADDMCLATPAIVGDRLIIRSSARVYCIQKQAQVAGN